MIANCPTLKRKEQGKSVKKPSPVTIVQTSPCFSPVTVGDAIDVAFKLFTSKGLVSLVGKTEQIPITILRDSGAKQSLICAHVLPFSSRSYSGLDIIVWGVWGS